MSFSTPKAKQSLEDLEKSIPTLSKYYKELKPHIKERYLDKITSIGFDPAVFIDAGAQLDSECLPPIDAVDILSYLVLDTSFYTKEQFKNFKSLEAYNYLISGFVSMVQGIKIADKYVVIGKVKHSQSMSLSLLCIWIICSIEGTILSGHCTGCKAGLAETWSHVASILYYVESYTRIHGKLACTEVKCSWLLPSYVKEVPYVPVAEINFKSARKLKDELDNRIDSASLDYTGNDCKPK